METIKDSFINKVKSAATLGIGVQLILGIGHREHKKTAAKYPDAWLMVGVGAPTDPDPRVVKYIPTHKMASDLIEANPNVVLELVLTELIQYWFDFLSDVYRYLLSKVLAGDTTIKLRKCQVKLNPTDLGIGDINTYVENSCVDAFDFENAQEKLVIVRKALNVDLTGVQNQVNEIKKFITIRNIFQHNLGVIRHDDITAIGSTSITLDEGDKITEYKVGDRIKISPFDIEICADSLIEVNNALIH